MQEIVLSVRNVSKKFCRSLKKSLFYAVQDISRELLRVDRRSSQLRSGEFWALKDISFDLKAGESIGLIGRNGAGKTTLLRIISGLIKPDTGYVKIKGRVAPLIALGAGFHNALSGRENIYANMSILGLNGKEIKAKFDEIVEFAEIGDAIDAPVQTYSSGMIARLGFACAVHTEPDVLLIDEVLAVGDIRFRIKCYQKLTELREQGTAFILVSHNSQSILTQCGSAIYLKEGNVVYAGDATKAILQYETNLSSEDVTAAQNAQPYVYKIQKKAMSDKTSLNIGYLCFRDEHQNIISNPTTGETAILCIGCEASIQLDNVVVHVYIRRVFGETEHLTCISNLHNPLQLDKGNSEIRIKMLYCGLKHGTYTAKIGITQGALDILDALENWNFSVIGKEAQSGLFYQPTLWTVEKSSKDVD